MMKNRIKQIVKMLLKNKKKRYLKNNLNNLRRTEMKSPNKKLIFLSWINLLRNKIVKGNL